MIKAINVTKTVTVGKEKLTIIKAVNLQVNKHESIALVGASGSGKTTLLGLLAGLDIPTNGEIWVQDQKISHLTEEQRSEMRGKFTGFIFQSFHLLPKFNALENVTLPLELNGDTQSKQKAENMLRQVGLQDRLKHFPSQLSGGEQQRVAIARAFVTKPKILYADEPTGNLDQKTGNLIADLLFKLNTENGTTLILVTHQLSLAQRCNRVLNLEAGEICQG